MSIESPIEGWYIPDGVELACYDRSSPTGFSLRRVEGHGLVKVRDITDPDELARCREYDSNAEAFEALIEAGRTVSFAYPKPDPGDPGVTP